MFKRIRLLRTKTLAFPLVPGCGLVQFLRCLAAELDDPHQMARFRASTASPLLTRTARRERLNA